MRGSKILVILASVALVAAACSSTSTPEASGTPAASATVAATEAAKKKVTFVTALIADANWAGGNKCWNDEVTALGFEGTMVAPQGETASNADMVTLAEQAIANKPDAIEVVPLNPTAWDDVLGKLKAANIPTVALLFEPSSKDLRTAIVLTNNTEYGTAGADLMITATGGTGKVGILWGGPDLANQVEAIKGFKAQIAAKAPGLSVVAEEINIVGGNRSPEAQAEIARGMLVANPEINAIYTPDGGGAVAAVDAAKELNKQPGDIKIIGSDHLPKVADAIATGYMFASVGYPFCAWGKAAVDTMDQIFKGTLTQTEIVIPSQIFDKDHNT
jgi:ribose transport system substrate-binding protein